MAPSKSRTKTSQSSSSSRAQEPKRKGMNRRELQQLAEYGHIGQPWQQGNDEVDEDEERLVKIIDDTKEGRRTKSKVNHVPSVATETVVATDADETWEQPSTIDALLQSFQKHVADNKPSKRATKGIEEEQEDKETMVKHSKKRRIIDEPVADDKSEDNEDEGHVDEDEEKTEPGEDWFDVHFGEEAVDELSTSSELQQGEGFSWHIKHYPSKTLGQVTVHDTVETDQEEDQPIQDVSPSTSNFTFFSIKPRLMNGWQRLNGPCLSDKEKTAGIWFTPLQAAMLGHVSEYKDLYFSQSNAANDQQIRNIMALHALNHCLKTRDRVLKNTSKINAAIAEKTEVPELRDQGYTRPKVLFLVPFRHSALQIVRAIIDVAPADSSNGLNVENKKRFFEEFGISQEEQDERDQQDPQSDKKPSDYLRTFEGNIDDCFRIGIKVTRKTFKLYADFYSSDILIASPLGLRLIIGVDGDKQRDFDFLSSIEICVIDQAHIFNMQNWDHLMHVIDHLNITPRDGHGCDFSRVRTWYLDGLAKLARQTVFLSEYAFPEANAFFNRHCQNYSGKIRAKAVANDIGTISHVIPQVQQIFHRLSSADAVAVEDARFDYFINKILPSVQSSSMSKHTCVFVPSYFEYVRIRNHFRTSSIPFAGISEYSRDSNISRARSWFFHGQRDLLLYSERFHFFRRYKIRGVKHVIFYALPTNAHFYPELLNMLEGTEGISCTVLFSKLDALKLERIVGHDRATRMISSSKPVFMFC